MAATRSLSFRVSPLIPVAMLLACGGPQAGGQTAAATDTEISCPAPIGTIVRENCANISEDFGALTVSGALKIANSSKGAEERIEAIRAAGDLARNLKDRRVDLCVRYNACKMTLAEHNQEDAKLAALMKSLIDLWDARKFLDSDGVKELHGKVDALTAQLEGKPVATPGSSGETKPAKVQVFGDKLVKVEGTGLSFSAASGALTISLAADGPHDALRAGPSELQTTSGSRYVIHISGSYKPAAPTLINPGDEISVRLKYRAKQAGEAYVALRSLEDPDAIETTTTFAIAKAGTGDQQATFTATPAASGFYLGVGSRGEGAIEFDNVEIVRAGTVIASALAESASETHVETTCSIGKSFPLAGKASFVCMPGGSDAITIGRPRGHLFIAVRSSSADERSILRTLSLDGGRSVDATFTDATNVVIGLVGPGSATIQSVDVTKL